MLPSFYTPRFSPESFELFLYASGRSSGLRFYFNAFPLKAVAKIEASQIESFYSYGDSSGFEPDSHFNSAPIIIGTETNYAANVNAIKYEFKNDLYTMLYNFFKADLTGRIQKISNKILKICSFTTKRMATFY